MKHTTVAADCTTYEQAFDIAARLAGTPRKDAWRGRVRIRYHRTTNTFRVQVPNHADG
jgi:hypothetical protein